MFSILAAARRAAFWVLGAVAVFFGAFALGYRQNAAGVALDRLRSYQEGRRRLDGVRRPSIPADGLSGALADRADRLHRTRPAR